MAQIFAFEIYPATATASLSSPHSISIKISEGNYPRYVLAGLTSPDEGDGAGLQLGAEGVGGAALHRAVVSRRVEVELQQTHGPVTRELRRRQLDKLLHTQREDCKLYFTFISEVSELDSTARE